MVPQELEIYLHSHNTQRLSNLQNLAQNLMQENVMSTSVQSDSESLSTRFDALNSRVCVSMLSLCAK